MKKKTNPNTFHFNMSLLFLPVHIIICDGHLYFQTSTAKALGLDANKVDVRIKRIGGAFGGKQCQCNYLAVCALAAQK